MPSRLLIAVGAAAESTEQVPDSVRALLDHADEILVVAPSLPDRVHWLASDTDKARMGADERLGTVLGQLRELGHEPEGTVGADDPLLAFADALEEYDADHILIAIRGQGEGDWQERGLVEQIVERFRLPVTVFSAGSD